MVMVIAIATTNYDVRQPHLFTQLLMEQVLCKR
jgi:hypothetical protein